jgi:hypothetical protein
VAQDYRALSQEPVYIMEVVEEEPVILVRVLAMAD